MARRDILVDDFLIQGSYRYVFDKSKRYGLYEQCFSTFVECLAFYDNLLIDLPYDAGSLSDKNHQRHYEMLNFFKGDLQQNQYGVDTERFRQIYDRYVVAPAQKLTILGINNAINLREYLSGKRKKVEISIPALRDADEIPYAKYQLNFYELYRQFEGEILDIYEAELEPNITYIQNSSIPNKEYVIKVHESFMTSSLLTYKTFRSWVICNSNNLNYVPNPISNTCIRNSSLAEDAVFSPFRKMVIDAIRREIEDETSIRGIRNELKELSRSTEIRTYAPALLNFITHDAKDSDVMRNRILELRNSKEARSYRDWCSKLEKPKIGRGRMDVIKEIRYAAEDLNERFDIEEKPHKISWRISPRFDPLNPLGLSSAGELTLPNFRKVWRRVKQRIKGDKHIDFLRMAI